MDKNDRQTINENFKNLLDNQNDVNDLIKRQTTVIDTTTTVLKKTMDQVYHKFKELADKLTNFYHDIANSQNNERTLLMFQLMTSEKSLLLDCCEKTKSDINGVLIDVNHGHINP
jgi:uncharacterized protein YdcH (DUF465 family)